ncbi:MAG: hypothetical protein AAF609_09375 [Cyanobacteria bacterium P01_C01_bin.120]
MSLPSPLTSTELKGLLLLLKYPKYRATAAVLQPQLKLSARQGDRLWQRLQQWELVDFEVIVTRFGLSAVGRTLLQLDQSVLPVTPDEKYVLQSCCDRSAGPQQISAKVPPDCRQPLLAGLAQQGLIRVTQQKLENIWLTTRGKAFLRYEYEPQGDTPVISLTLLNGYLRFMRQIDPQIATAVSPEAAVPVAIAAAAAMNL